MTAATQKLKKNLLETVKEMEMAYGYPVRLKILNNQYINRAKSCGFATVLEVLEVLAGEGEIKICFLPRRGARVILPMQSYLDIEASPNNTIIHHLTKFEDFLKSGPAPLEQTND